MPSITIGKQYATRSKMYHMVPLVLLLSTMTQGSTPPKVEDKPLLLDSFIPATMQIIAYITEIMKFDIKPTTAATTTSTTTAVPPTKPHKPAILAPDHPLGAQFYGTINNPLVTYDQYVRQLLQGVSQDYFTRIYGGAQESRSVQQDHDDVVSQLKELVGANFGELWKLINVDEDPNQALDVDDSIREFSTRYDDLKFGLEALRQKKPPTRAYVALLFLYDLLNKESKRLGLNKYNGYSEAILGQLYEISTGTSADQLRAVLSKVKERKDTNNAQILRKITELVKDLDEGSSYINAAMRHIPPLAFAS